MGHKSSAQKLRALKKRIEFLTKRIDEAHAEGRMVSFDREERISLLWAVDIIEGRLPLPNFERD